MESKPCGSAEYRVVATDAPILHRGGVAVLYRDSPQFAIEEIQQFGTNVVSFHLEAG